jgi:hypothetical protein
LILSTRDALFHPSIRVLRFGCKGAAHDLKTSPLVKFRKATHDVGGNRQVGHVFLILGLSNQPSGRSYMVVGDEQSVCWSMWFESCVSAAWVWIKHDIAVCSRRSSGSRETWRRAKHCEEGETQVVSLLRANLSYEARHVCKITKHAWVAPILAATNFLVPMMLATAHELVELLPPILMRLAKPRILRCLRNNKSTEGTTR